MPPAEAAAGCGGVSPVAPAPEPPGSPQQQAGPRGGRKGAGKKGSGRGAGDHMQITDINELVKMMAKLVLKNSQEIRTLSTSAMTTLALPTSHPLIQRLKDNMDKYWEAGNAMTTPEQRQMELGPPSWHSMNTIISWAV